MTHSYAQAWMHIVFSTKERKAFLADKTVRAAVHTYLAGVCRQMGSQALIVGGIGDHVHILCNQSKNVAMRDLVQRLKQGSSLWIKRQWPALGNFYWQEGYAHFSVSPSLLEQARAYIANQEQHHRVEDFQDEYRAFLIRAKIPFNEQDLWD